MKKEIHQVDKERGIVRVTTLDERFYGREVEDPETGLPVIQWRPSITYIGTFYPKGKQYENFLKKNGDDADVIRDLAGERGSKVHQAIEQLNKGEEVKFNDTFVNSRNGEVEELTPDEYYCVMTYRDWWEKEGKLAYEILEAEDIIWPEGPGSEPGGPLHFAATRDLRLRRKSDGTTGTVDVKTSKAIYASHLIQVSAIAEAVGDQWQAIFQAGYTPNKCGYKFTEVDRHMELVAAAMTIHRHETSGEKPLQREYPLSMKLDGVKSATEKAAARRKKSVAIRSGSAAPKVDEVTETKAA